MKEAITTTMENVRTWLLPKAEKLDFIVEPLLQRSWNEFLKNGRKDVVSEYMGGNIITITTQADGQVFQIALDRSEIGELPPDMQRMLKRDLASQPIKRGRFAAEVKIQ